VFIRSFMLFILSARDNVQFSARLMA